MDNIFSISDTTNISLFKKICDTVKNLSDNLYIKITENNINFQVMDDVKISIINICFDKLYFDIFDIKHNNNICINIIDFNKILKNCSKTNTIYFKLKHETNILSITSKLDESISKKFKINLQDTSFYDWINIDTFNSTNSHISILSKTLQTIISELNVFSDYLIIKKNTNNNKLLFIIDDVNNNIFSKYEIDNIDLMNTENIQLMVSLNNLNNFKLFSNFTYTYLNISNENPLHINLKDKFININYMLAPKIDI